MNSDPKKPSLFRRIPAAAWVTLAVTALVAGRYFWVQAQKPAHLHELAREFGSIGYFHGLPRANQDGSKLTFVQSTETGLAVFVCDTKSGQKQNIHEETELAVFHRNFRVWAWSPDDKYFIYTRESFAEPANAMIMTRMTVCEGDAPAKQTDVEIGQDHPRALAWLNGNQFAYVTEQNALQLVQKQADGTWKQAASPTNVVAPNLVALAGGRLAWFDTNGVQVMEASSGTVSTLNTPANDKLVGLDYSKDTDRLLLDHKSGAVSQWNPDAAMTNDLELADAYLHAAEAVWLNGGRGHAVLEDAFEHHFVALKTDESAKPVELCRAGSVQNIFASADGSHLFVVGEAADEPAPGIWEYDVSGGNFHCVVPCSDTPIRYLKRAEPYEQWSLDHFLTTYTYKPVHYNPKKKYPLVIAFTPYPYHEHGNDLAPICPELFPNCDIYLVIADRALWGNALNTWDENVMSVYKRFLNDPALSIDPNRVYLLTRSIENTCLSGVWETNALPWRGFIALNGYPQIPDNPTAQQTRIKLLISMEDWGQSGQVERRLIGYQTAAQQAGITAEYVLHRNAPHDFRAKQSLRGRAEAFVEFLFDE